MLNFSLPYSRFDYGVNTSTSGGISLTNSGVAHTKGSWIEIIASTAFHANGMLVGLGSSTLSRDYLVDVAFGAASSEVVVCPNLIAQEQGVPLVSYWTIPISIPQGTRISARAQNNATSGDERCIIYPYHTPFPPYGIHAMTVYGATTSTTTGVSIDPGGSANTKGSWVQITSGTSVNHALLWFGIGNSFNTARTSCGWLIDVGIGGAGSEVVIIPNLRVTCDASAMDQVAPYSFGPYYLPLPSGTRVAVRAQCSITDATDRLFDAYIYGA